ncbi:class I adenylate-forming enzyme family protein [Bradyrhizobium tropiciagri]|uniref:class I adenylate-forming enzyme family protein n=1 Tax=Bradyrhizobium tropiciagri TaxID=312253 RepID=UPI00067D4DB4|nr:AMP-binding protein [Bradyrhizobium tropiciagri]
MRIIDHFDQGVAYYPDAVAFHDLAGGGSLTYREADHRGRLLAAAIRGHGFGKGVKIGILAPNSSLAFVTLIGLMRADAIWLPLNPRNPPAVNADLLRRFDGELLFFSQVHEQDAQHFVSEVPELRATVCLDGESLLGPSLEAWTSQDQAGVPSSEYSPDDMFAIFPTGGTTGQPKGVMITHRNIAAMFSNFMSHFGYYEGARHLVVAPMTHSAGILGCLHFSRGGCNVIMAKADPGAILAAIQDHRITHLFLPPTVLYMLLAHPDLGRHDYGSLRHLLVAAAPSSLGKLKEAIRVFGPVLSETFGQAECPAAICLKAPWDYLNAAGEIDLERLHSVGRPGVWNKVAILDQDGAEQPRGSPGEICVCGPLVTPGYYKDPASTAAIRRFGWHHTGDVGVMDKHGYVTIVDRKKDMIISGGFNIFPNEIEQILTSHPAVQDCSVIGVPDEKWGEAVKAVVQLKTAAKATEAELIALVKRALGGVKAPKSVDFVDDLPRSAAGKVLKAELRAAYWHGRTRAVN